MNSNGIVISTSGPARVPCTIFAKLADSRPPGWVAEIERLREAEEVQRSLYGPLRNALNAEFRVPGSGREVLEWQSRKWKLTPSNQAVLRKSHEALSTFEDRFRQRFSGFIKAYPCARKQAIKLGEVLLQGGFHSLVADRQGNQCLLWYHASEWEENWKVNQVEMLALIAEERYKLARTQVFMLDFADGKIRRPLASGSRVRRSLEEASVIYNLISKNV